MITLNENQRIDEKILNETIKEVFYSLDSSGQFEVGRDSEEYMQARDNLDNFLNERIKDQSSLNGFNDVLSTVLLVTEAQGFVDGFKAASILGTRKSALIKLNESLSEKVEG